MFNLVIFGAPGSGKGTQSERIIDKYGLVHISTGDVLRKEIAAGTELGKIADSYISHGHLIPDDLMVRILADVIDRSGNDVKGFIFDGFPRTIKQAEELEKMLEKRGPSDRARQDLGPRRRQSRNHFGTSEGISFHHVAPARFLRD